MKHLKIILFVLGAMSLSTCTSIDETPEKYPVEIEESPKVYYTLGKKKEIEVQTGEVINNATDNKDKLNE